MIESEFITWEAPDGEHPVRRLSQRSYDLVSRKQKDEWLTLWAEDAVIEDPVGPSFFDPDGNGHHGLDAISAFWDLAIAPVKAPSGSPSATPSPTATPAPTSAPSAPSSTTAASPTPT